MKTLSIGWVYVLRVLREPASLFFFFVFPVAMVFIIGIQFGGEGGRLQMGISGDTSQSVTDGITANLAGNQALELVFYEDESEMLMAVERGLISAGVVFPPQLAARMALGQPVLIGFVSTASGWGPQLESTVRQAVAEVLIPYRAARLAVDILGVGFQQSFPLASEVTDQVVFTTVSLESVGESLFPPNMGRFDGGAASNLVLFMFLTALTGATAMVADRDMGLDTRIVSTPTSVPRLISGYVAGQFGITFFQGVYIMVLSLAIFGVGWSNLGGSVLLVMALSLAGAGAGMLLGSFRLAEAATIGIGVTAGLVLGALGGAMVPQELLPDTVQTVARFTPQGWAMLGFRDLQWGGSILDIADNLAVLAGMGVVLAGAASVSLRRTLARPS
ncbi:MAG: ABC transporter permease [bacterium]|nr:ABC transporter permease [bacterium]MDE0602670.1 ABC transporter permease [bacterium]